MSRRKRGGPSKLKRYLRMPQRALEQRARGGDHKAKEALARRFLGVEKAPLEFNTIPAWWQEFGKWFQEKMDRMMLDAMTGEYNKLSDKEKPC